MNLYQLVARAIMSKRTRETVHHSQSELTVEALTHTCNELADEIDAMTSDLKGDVQEASSRFSYSMAKARRNLAEMQEHQRVIDRAKEDIDEAYGRNTGQP